MSDEAGEEDKAENVLAYPLDFFDLNFFEQTEEVARPITHSLSTKR
jgi:hypothetical protein